jgi:methyl-accepting chemotaxis protein
MLKFRFRAQMVYLGISLGAVVLLRTFVSLLFERTTDRYLGDLTVDLSVALVGAVVVLVALGRRLAPVEAFLRTATDADPGTRESLRLRLAALPTFLFRTNVFLFLAVAVVGLTVETLSGQPLPGPLDLGLIVAIHLAVGFMAALQELGAFDTLGIPVRRRLALTAVAGSVRELSLSRRLFLVNLGAVLLAGLLAGMAALGFYREVVAYYTKLGADAVAAASEVSHQAVSDNELKVMIQFGLQFLAILGWTVTLTTMALRTVVRQLKDLEGRVGEMADGAADLGRRAEVLFFDEVGSLTGRVNAMMDRLQHVVGAIQSTSAQVLGSTTQVQAVSLEAERRLEAVTKARSQAEGALTGQGEALGATLEVAQGLEQSSVSVKAVAVSQGEAVAQGASAMEQLAASVTSVREMTDKAAGLSNSLRTTSDSGGKSVEAVRQAMGAIQEAAQAVAGTVATIKKTAAQTNLLAMNAAIEAAHAGDSGLGFAVVASEVRVLAENSSRGAKTIADLMRDMDARIAEGDRLAREAGEAFARIYSLIVETSQVMETVALAMDEQQAGTDTLLATTRTLREASLQIGAVTEKQSDHAVNLNRSVQILVETGASLAMAQEVQGRAMAELTELVHSVAREADRNADAASTLGRTVEGFTVR